MQNLRGLIREDELVGDKSQETTNSSQAMKENKASEWQAGESQRNDVEVDKSVGVYLGPDTVRLGVEKRVGSVAQVVDPIVSGQHAHDVPNLAKEEVRKVSLNQLGSKSWVEALEENINKVR
ncbi:hypothetical protein V6N13_064190 [Hibiscus sabdariffa]